MAAVKVPWGMEEEEEEEEEEDTDAELVERESEKSSVVVGLEMVVVTVAWDDDIEYGRDGAERKLIELFFNEPLL